MADLTIASWNVTDVNAGDSISDTNAKKNTVNDTTVNQVADTAVQAGATTVIGKTTIEPSGDIRNSQIDSAIRRLPVGLPCPIGQATSGGDITALITSATGNDDSLYFDELDAANLRICRLDVGDYFALTVNNAGSVRWWLDSASYKNSQGIACAYGSTDYVYCWAQKVADSLWYLLRISCADGSISEMSFSGTAPTNNNAERLAFDAYGYLWILENNTTTAKKYSISGTTATYVSTTTLSATFNSTASRVYAIDPIYDRIMYADSTTTIRLDTLAGVNIKTLKGISNAATSARYYFPRSIFSNLGTYYAWVINTTTTTSGQGIGYLSQFSGY